MRACSRDARDLQQVIEKPRHVLHLTFDQRETPPQLMGIHTVQIRNGGRI
jgi:hypothetical protein